MTVGINSDQQNLEALTNPPRCEIRVLNLIDGRHSESDLHRLQKGWILQFRLGPSLFGHRVTIYTNHPAEPGQPYSRTAYRKLKWQSDSKNKDDDTAVFVDVPLLQAGPFHYYFTCEDSFDARRGSGYYLVDPVITYGSNEVLPLDCIQCQTYLAKSLGHLEEWEQRLLVAKESGYNVIHFTPVQEIGGSRSSYSLRDQLKLNPDFSRGKVKHTMKDLERLTTKMRDQWKVISICDIVLNHSSNDSPWLQEHPDGAYNLENSPHLRPSYLLDRILWHFALEIAAGKWESSGIPAKINEEYHLDAVRAALHGFFLPQVKIQELYMVDVGAIVKEFFTQAKSIGISESKHSDEPLTIIQDPNFRRFGSSVNMKLVLDKFNVSRDNARSEAERLQWCSQSLREKLEELNHDAYNRTQIHLSAGVENVLAGMRYQRLQHDGPRIAEVSRKNPLVPKYFTDYGADAELADEEKLMYSDKAKFLMAHNGWVMNDDPLRNFADADSNVYLRRELICWGDSIKLRYGKGPEDSPYLWQHMQEYAKTTALTFDGIRLDNCHSTPIHAAEYMLDAARRVRPELYVVAELFTQSENIDNIFVNRLGINSLIREAMSAGDAHEEGRLVYRYGGQPVGAFFKSLLQPLVPSIAHALFLDLTHDNPSPVEKRSAYDLLPSSALVSMACCATGSNRGYDELVPHHIHVVDEYRLYSSWSSTQTADPAFTSLKSGIIAGKRAINRLHYELGSAGFSEVYVDQVDPDIVAVTRHCPTTHQSVILVAFTAFRHPANPRDGRYIPPLCVPGLVVEVIFEAGIVHKEKGAKYSKSETHINGLPDYQVEVRENIQLYESDLVELRHGGSGGQQEIVFTNFHPGSVIAFRVSLHKNSEGAILELRNCISQFGFGVNPYGGDYMQARDNNLFNVISHLTLADLNRVLFRCAPEEQDEGKDRGVYMISKIGAMPYCGLQGVVTLFSDIRLKNDLGHPLCDNLRQGDWLPDYISSRLKLDPQTRNLGLWFENIFSKLKTVPRYLIPCYFDAIITGIYCFLLNHTWSLMSNFISEGSSFVRFLALGSVILGGAIRSAPLPQLSPNLLPPNPPTTVEETYGHCLQNCTTLSAGLPHFSTGYMRNWGRDTFIALRGLFLITGRHAEARFMILGFGGCLRHGLIPNLLDGGKHARFNCRDAIWLWLQSIQDYCHMVDGGTAILKDRVLRLFPTDDDEAYSSRVEQNLEDVIQEALQRHVQGHSFRERNAGFNLDREMKDEGFNNRIGVDPKTGFVFGGNVHNCGTWMDKMGSSEAAGTKGKPATPRDGSAVEIVGLCKSAIRWLIHMNRKGLYPYNAVTFLQNDTEHTLTFESWNQKILDNFERCFWVPNGDYSGYEINAELVNSKNIYKDSFGASQGWADYQLRCNFPVAMAVAPELFNPQHAWISLQVVEKQLMGPLGIKTLGENDWAYNGYYDNSNNSGDPKVTNGYNYHQGPEWLWPMGHFLRAKLHFAASIGESTLMETILFVKKTLAHHFEAVQKSEWRGLPELTNRNGAHCPGSCPVQAWSMGCLLEVLYDLNNISSEKF